MPYLRGLRCLASLVLLVLPSRNSGDDGIPLQDLLRAYSTSRAEGHTTDAVLVCVHTARICMDSVVL